MNFLARIRDLAWALVRPFFDFVPFLAVLLFFGALFWAKVQDPFSRKWFTLKAVNSVPLSPALSPPGRGEGEESVRCVTVLPKKFQAWRCPVVIYAHGSHGSLMNDGNALRQMAEMGLATISLEYDQTNGAAFAGQFEAVLRYIADSDWADTNAIAWVGFSLGANRMLDYAVQHPDRQPKLMVQLSGRGIQELALTPTLSPQERESPLTNRGSSAGGTGDSTLAGNAAQTPTVASAGVVVRTNLHCAVLMVHGEQDLTFPLADTQQLASALKTNGVAADLKVVPGAPHAMEPDTGVVFRCIGEYCRTHLMGKNALQSYYSIAQFEADAPAFWLFCLPAAAWLIFGFVRHRKKHPREKIKLTRGEIALRWVAGVLAAWALTVTAVHLVTPHFLVSEGTLSVARKHLVEPKESGDFEYLAAQPIWNGQKLRALLDHVELAVYNRELINWKLDDKVYREFVLSPAITSKSGEQLNWRRPLWEEFYPRIRHENSTEDAARIVVRHLRERVTIASIPNAPHQIPEIWLKQITDEAGFEIIYVAALRSVGVPSRLNADAKAEFWNGAAWAKAPEPVIAAWN